MPAWSRLLLVRWWILLAITLAACRTREVGPSEWQLESGGSLGELAARVDTVVVLVYDPSDCFACSSVLGRWLDAKRQSPGHVFLLFTRRPNEDERDQLKVYRIEPDAILSRRQNRGGIKTPFAVFLRKGTVVAVRTPGSFEGDTGVLESLERRPAQLRTQ